MIKRVLYSVVRIQQRREKPRGAIKQESGELCESFVANHRE